MGQAINKLMGITTRRQRIATAKPHRVLFRQAEAAALMAIDEARFRRLVQTGVIQPVNVPSSVPGKVTRRYTRECLEEAARKMMDQR